MVVWLIIVGLVGGGVFIFFLGVEVVLEFEIEGLIFWF